MGQFCTLHCPFFFTFFWVDQMMSFSIPCGRIRKPFIFSEEKTLLVTINFHLVTHSSTWAAGRVWFCVARDPSFKQCTEWLNKSPKDLLLLYIWLNALKMCIIASSAAAAAIGSLSGNWQHNHALIFWNSFISISFFFANKLPRTCRNSQQHLPQWLSTLGHYEFGAKYNAYSNFVRNAFFCHVFWEEQRGHA